jgi:hypothetical protein
VDRPVRAVCGLFRRFGYELLLLTVTVEDRADLDAVPDAVGAAEQAVVRLDADPATLRQRIIEREPGGWAGLDELLAVSARLSPVIAGLAGVALALSIEGERPPAVAERIRDAIPAALRPGWP